MVWFIQSVTTAKSPFSFFSQMANHSQQQKATSLSPLFSASECIAWLSVFGILAVATVALNAVTIIVYLKERSLCKRSMYLVINQAVANMLLGTSLFIDYWILGIRCNLWTNNPVSNPLVVFINVISTVFDTASIINLAAISLERTHATFRPFKHRLAKKKKLEPLLLLFGLQLGSFQLAWPYNILNYASFLSYIVQLSCFAF